MLGCSGLQLQGEQSRGLGQRAGAVAAALAATAATAAVVSTLAGTQTLQAVQDMPGGRKQACHAGTPGCCCPDWRSHPAAHAACRSGPSARTPALDASQGGDAAGRGGTVDLLPREGPTLSLLQGLLLHPSQRHALLRHELPAQHSSGSVLRRQVLAQQQLLLQKGVGQAPKGAGVHGKARRVGWQQRLKVGAGEAEEGGVGRGGQRRGGGRGGVEQLHPEVLLQGWAEQGRADWVGGIAGPGACGGPV